MKEGMQVRRSNVQTSVGSIARGSDGRGVGGPHRRRARHQANEKLRVPAGAREHLLVAAREAEPSQRPQARPIVRRQHPLPAAKAVYVAHFSETLERREARVRRVALVGHAGHISVTEPAIVVRRADDAVEVVLAPPARALHHAPSSRAAPSTPAESPSKCRRMGVSSSSLKTYLATRATPSV